MVKRCQKCGYSGRPELEQGWLIAVALIAWIIPLSFLSMGFWPFFLLPAVAITAWALMGVRLRCPSCKQRWSRNVLPE